MHGKMQESGLTEIIPLICTSALWGQNILCFLMMEEGQTHPLFTDTAGNVYSVIPIHFQLCAPVCVCEVGGGRERHSKVSAILEDHAFSQQ